MAGATQWQARPPDYDSWFDEPWGRYASGVEARALHRAAPALCGALVLDGGCGTGRFATSLRSAGARVIGVDLDAGMVDLAVARLPTRVVRGDLVDLPFLTGVFDVTMAVTVLELVDDPAAVMAELARVTRPGGHLLVGALNPHSPWGLANRRRLRSGVWGDARFLARHQLLALGAAHGMATIQAALYAPGWFWGLDRIGPLLEGAGRLAPGWGAFQVLAVDLPLTCHRRAPSLVWSRSRQLVPVPALSCAVSTPSQLDARRLDLLHGVRRPMASRPRSTPAADL